MFNTMNSGYSLADIAAATGGNNSRNDDGFMGGGWSWWIIVLFLFVFCGWGNGGWGGNSGMTDGALTRADLCQDMNFSEMSSGIRGLQSGLCDGFYAQNTNLLNGFASVNNALATGFAGVDNAVCTLGYQTQQGVNSINVANMQNTNAIQQDINAMNIANMQATNALQAQLAQCCCDSRADTANLKYQMATDTCAITTAAANNTRDIIDSQNANARAILDAIQQGKIDAMQDRIAALTAEKQALQFAASQTAQNQYLVGELKQCPVAAYVVPNPFTGCCGNYGCACGA